MSDDNKKKKEEEEEEDDDRNDRYIISYGKFGAYFYDIDRDKAMTLDHVLGMLNHLERISSMNR